MASFRYRAMWIARAASEKGMSCLVTDDADAVSAKIKAASNEIEAIVFAKAFTPAAFDLAWAAKKAEIPVIIDLCDNIFIDNYLGGKQGYHLLSRFYSMQHIADRIVVPTESLKEVVSAHIGGRIPITVIPDGIETLDDIIELIKLVELNPQAEAQKNECLAIAVKAKRRTSAGNNFLSALFNRYCTRSTIKHFRNRVEYALHNPQKIIPFLKRRLGGNKLFYRKVINGLQVKTQDVGQENRSADQLPTQNYKKVIWFGNSGQSHGNFGISTVLQHADVLKQINKEVPVELIIVSNDRRLFEAYIQPLPIKTTYVEWDPVSIYSHLAAADVCIVTNSGDSFSQTKSPNRVVLALSCGTPVVADDFQSLEHLRDCIVVDDWEKGLRRYLLEGNTATDLEQARGIIALHYSDDAIGVKFQKVMSDIQTNDVRSQTTILVVLDLIQDLEIVKPILLYLHEQEAYRLRILVTSWLISRSPRVLSFLNKLGLKAEVKDRNHILNGDQDYLVNVDAILLPTETNLNPHRVSHHIAMQAKGKIKTITFQHGLENVGLSYFDAHSVSIASDLIITWNEQVQENPAIESSIKDRCIPLGMFKEITQGMTVQELQEKVGYQRVIGVFENLHWDRYDDAYREQFLISLQQTAAHFPEVCFLIKPHHAGVWLNKAMSDNRLAINWPANIYIVEVSDSFWEPYTGNQIVGACDAVITTPSTIAVDSSLCGVPVAVVANNLEDLDYFGPLTLLMTDLEWIDFVEHVLGSSLTIRDSVDRFRSRTVKSLNPLKEFHELVLRK